MAMVGFITERHLQQADEAFPGIARFFECLSPKPRTFLDLLCAFQHQRDPGRDGREASGSY
jgi:hypothetical protein